MHSPSFSPQSSYHHGDLRNALIEAGEQLLVQRGAASLSLREVAKLAGVSHAAPYRHFRDKAALLQALAESGFERLGAVIRAAAERIPHDPELKLVETGVAYVRLAVRNPALVQLMFAAGPGQSEDRATRQAALPVFAPLLAIAKTGIETGVFRDRDPRELALVAWTSMHGLALLLVSGQVRVNLTDEAALDELVRSLVQNVIYGISR